MQDPKTIILIHETMVQEELQRNDPEHHLYVKEGPPIRGPITFAREALASLLYALGDRIKPEAYEIQAQTSGAPESTR